MPLTVIAVVPGFVMVRVVTTQPAEDKTWKVPRKQLGGLGAISAYREGERCTLGNFRTRDGDRMQPDYARLRSLLDYHCPADGAGRASADAGRGVA